MSSPALSQHPHPSYHHNQQQGPAQHHQTIESQQAQYGQPAPTWLDSSSVARSHKRQHSAASTASQMASPGSYMPNERGYDEASHQASQDFSGGMNASTSMVKQDSMYNSLPTYRFPPGPSPAASHNYSPSHSPSLSFRSGTSLHHYPESQHLHTNSSRKLQPPLELEEGPPLPSISLAEDTPPAPSTRRFHGYRDYDSRTGFPGGLVSPAEGEGYEVITPGSSNDTGHPPSTTNDHLGVSYVPSSEVYHQSPLQPPSSVSMAARPGPSGSAPANPVGSFTTYSSSTTHTHTTSSTFVPSSAYLPSKSAFSGMSPALSASTGIAPRSAPSTPLGRQDARFLSHTRAWTTPEPLVAPFFPSNGSPSPLIAQSPASLTSSVPPSFRLNASTSSSASSFFPSHDLERFHLSSSTSSKAETDYIPYARPPGPKSKRAPPPFAPTTPVMHVPMKKVKREKPTPKITKLPSPAAGSSTAGSPAPSAQNGEEEKPTRVKIACNACRKTRLKCDGLYPCTSCIDKHIKANPSDDEAEAKKRIEAANSCVFESTVRRRGKGKKTLAKERYQQEGGSLSPSSLASPNILGSSVSSLSSSMNAGNAEDRGYSAYVPHFVGSQPSPATQEYHHYPNATSPYLSPYPQHQQQHAQQQHQYHHYPQYPSNQHLHPAYPSQDMRYGLGVGLDHSRSGSSEHGSGAAADDF